MATKPIMAEFLKLPPQKSFHRRLENELAIDAPSEEDDPRFLFSMPFVALIDAVADILFPPNTVISAKGIHHKIIASDAMVHRYVLFRAVWQPDWGQDMHAALRLFSIASKAHHGKTFALLSDEHKTEALSLLEDRGYTSAEWASDIDQRRAFNQIREGIAEGFFSEPGYGGNRGGLGWYYSNFMMIED